MATVRGRSIWAFLPLLAATAPALGQETTIRVDFRSPGRPISPYLTGACIEDVNHEIYGGIYSQMIFGESFQEPPPFPGPFQAYGDLWARNGGEVTAGVGDGPKLVSDEAPFSDGEVGVEVRFPNDQAGNAGLILRVDRPEVGADAWTGYEVSLETPGFLLLGRHRRNWEPIRRIPWPVPVDRWVKLAVRMEGNSLEIAVDGKPAMSFQDTEHPLGPGRVGLRTWQRPASFRELYVKRDGSTRKLPFEPAGESFGAGVSKMWSGFRRGSASGGFAIETSAPFDGRQSQRITFRDGQGEVGVENRGLNRWGLGVVEGKPYEGSVWVRAESPTRLALALEAGDGSKILAESAVEVPAGKGWTRRDFVLTPSGSDRLGRFAIKLEQPGSVEIGRAFLQPGEWGRFKGLPDRKDVAEGLIDEGVSVLRYGGSMVNHPEYRWKKMIGPREHRPNSPGLWYPHSTNGWGIFDFLDLCEAAGFLAIPAVHMGESPQDMADFVEYANGPADGVWGRKRAADGHPKPYRLRHLELGNEEAINADYWKKFEPMAEAIWAKDPEIILVVGDFAYNKVIVDPYHFEGGAAANSLEVHKKILELARSRNREVWFDIHVWTDHPPEPAGMKPERSYIDHLDKLVPGAKHKVAIFEYNSGNHRMRRALSNALATNEAERLGDKIALACAANCLQPDGQNDNGWDQGLLFLNPSKVWLQPPGYVLQMTRRNYQPTLIESTLAGPSDKLSVNAKRSDDGKTLTLQVVNWDDAPRPGRIEAEGFTPARSIAHVEELAGPIDAANTAEEPGRVVPKVSEWPHTLKDGAARFTFAPRSFTIIRFD